MRVFIDSNIPMYVAGRQPPIAIRRADFLSAFKPVKLKAVPAPRYCKRYCIVIRPYSASIWHVQFMIYLSKCVLWCWT